jgi:hypothetical protein
VPFSSKANVNGKILDPEPSNAPIGKYDLGVCSLGYMFFACEHSNKDFVTVLYSLIYNNLSVIYSNEILQTTQNFDIAGN